MCRPSPAPNTSFVIWISHPGQTSLPSLGVGKSIQDLTEQGKTLACPSAGHRKWLHKPKAHGNCRMRGASHNKLINSVLYPSLRPISHRKLEHMSLRCAALWGGNVPANTDRPRRMSVSFREGGHGRLTAHLVWVRSVSWLVMISWRVSISQMLRIFATCAKPKLCVERSGDGCVRKPNCALRVAWL